MVGDVGIEKDLDTFINKTLNAFGKIDFLVNNACISSGGILSGCSYNDFDRALSVGLKAPYYLTLKTMPTITSVVNIASTRAFMSEPNTESYSATKGGIVALTHSLAISLGHKTRVNCISPGWINTTNTPFSKQDNEQHPVGRIGTPEDIAHLALYLCSSKASFITGQNFTVDGGMSQKMIYHGENEWEYNSN